MNIFILIKRVGETVIEIASCKADDFCDARDIFHEHFRFLDANGRYETDDGMRFVSPRYHKINPLSYVVVKLTPYYE